MIDEYGMLKDERLGGELATAISSLDAIRYVNKCDGEVHVEYVREKVETTERILNWLKAIVKQKEE